MKEDDLPSLSMKKLFSLEKDYLSPFPDNNITIPALILEHKIDDEISFDLEDLKQFYNKFGEILNIIISGKQHIVLFRYFLSAKICKIFLEDEENYKSHMKNNFIVKWFDINRDSHLIPDEVKIIFENINNINVNNNTGNIENVNNINNIPNPMNNFNRNDVQCNNNFINNIHLIQEKNILNNNNVLNSTDLYNINNNINLNGFNNNNVNNFGIMNNSNNFNNVNNINIVNKMNNINNLNININDNYNYNYRLINKNNFSYNNNNINNNINHINKIEDKISSKFICKYEILIENDQEFQISRKLIGSKGINMKKIINECHIKGDIETLKLRLRGKGSGFKEGPLSKESDEPLHLCISARTKEQLNHACFLVNNLFEIIYDEYKIFCQKKGIKPKTDRIARKIVDNKKFN